MEKLISCAFNMDTACVELRFSDGGICSIDTIAVENEIARNMHEPSELDYLICFLTVQYQSLVFLPIGEAVPPQINFYFGAAPQIYCRGVP